MKLNKSGGVMNRNQRILIGIVAILAFGYLLYIFIVQPANKKLAPTKERINILQEQVNNIDSIQYSIKNKEAQLKDLNVKYEEATKTIPKSDRYPQVIKDIDEMASAAGITVTRGAFSKPVVLATKSSTSKNSKEKSQEKQITEGLTAFSVDLEFSGNYNQCLEFVKQVEADERILEVVKFNIMENSEGKLGIVYYVSAGLEEENYDFDSGTYGKSNIFE